MARKQNPPAAYRDNANGTITVLGFKKPLIISKATAEYAKTWHGVTRDGQPVPAARWPGPIPLDCYSCRTSALFQTRSRRGGPELLWITYQCANCGIRDDEPLD